MKRYPFSCCLVFLFILAIAAIPAAATPYVSDVTPPNGPNNGVVTLTILGSGFNPERTAVYLSPADSCNSIRISGIIQSISSNTITARFSLSGVRPGYYSMWVNCPVTDPDGKDLDDKGALFKGFWIYQATFTSPPISLIPLAGAWTGSNADTVGLYQKNNGTFFLKNSNGPGDVDTVFQYGAGGDDWSPLVGDWDHDGSDTVGLYQTSTGTFFLKNSNGAGPGDLGFPYGAGGADWVHLAGDWDGDGNDTVGAYQKSIGTFFLKNSNGTGDADNVFRYAP